MRPPASLPPPRALRSNGPARRRVLRAAVGAGIAALGLPGAVLAAPRSEDSGHFPFGPLTRPRALASWAVQTHLDQAGTLEGLLRGKTTALQLMFTGCNATCPLQGALFAQTQRGLAASGGAGLQGLQLLSLSIDALGDSPAALARWLGRFGAQPGWLAAVPKVADVDAIIERLGRGGEPRPAGNDPHTGQVYLINRRAELVLRTPNLPSAAQVVSALRDTADRFR
jgi:protein SCO1